MKQPVAETAQYDGSGALVSRTVTSAAKTQLLAARELSRLDGSYQRAATAGHVQRKAADAYIAQWSKRLRREATSDPAMVEYDSLTPPTADAVAGQGSAIADSVADSETIHEHEHGSIHGETSHEDV